jgi:hypothetical protein
MGFLMKRILLLACLFFYGCRYHHVEVTKLPINRSGLASSFTKAPDPRQKAPPEGEQLLVHCNLDSELDITQCKAVVSMIYNNLESETVEYQLRAAKEDFSLFVLGEKFKRTQGVLTYKVEIVSDDTIIYTKQHPMWFKKIEPEHE